MSLQRQISYDNGHTNMRKSPHTSAGQLNIIVALKSARGPNHCS